MLLSYRIPREPSTPRIAVWRKLKELGVTQLGDGLVALPSDARTREHLEWVAAQVLEADGDAIVWVATPSRRRDSVTLAQNMRAERSAEYAALTDEIASSPEKKSRTISRWRRTWRRIDRRDYFRSDGRDEAKRAIADAVAANEASAVNP